MLRGIPAIEPKDVIIGQYGKSLDGNKPAYKEDDTVPKDSRCPTFCAMVAHIKNERWDGVPFILKGRQGYGTVARRGDNVADTPSPQRAKDRDPHPVQGT